MGRRTARKADGPRQAEHILIVRLDEIGDLVLTTPFLRELRRSFPTAWMALVVKPGVLNLVELCPYVNEVLTFDPRMAGRCVSVRRHWRALSFAVRSLWKQRFELAICPRVGYDAHRAGCLAYFSGARWRVGWSVEAAREATAGLCSLNHLFTHVLPDPPVQHEVQSNLDVLRSVGGMIVDTSLELLLTDEDRKFAERLCATNSIVSEELLVGMGVGAAHSQKRWPPARFLQLASWLVRQHQARIVIVGGDADVAIATAIGAALPGRVISVAGQATLRQSAAVLARCRLFIGNDSGPMHMAAGMGVPVVELSCHPRGGWAGHNRSPLRFGPWGVPHIVLQPELALSPCQSACVVDDAHCITSISVEVVQKAVARLLCEQTANTSARGRDHE